MKKYWKLAISGVLVFIVLLLAVDRVVEKLLLSRPERESIQKALEVDEVLTNRFGAHYIVRAIDAGSEVFINPDGSRYGSYPFVIKTEKGSSEIRVRWVSKANDQVIAIDIYDTTGGGVPVLLTSTVVSSPSPTPR